MLGEALNAREVICKTLLSTCQGECSTWNIGTVSDKFRLAKNLRLARVAKGLTQIQAAALVQKSRQTVNSWEREDESAASPDDADLDVLAEAYGVTRATLRYGESAAVIRHPLGERESWTPNPALRGAVPARVYQVALGYCSRLQAAGVPADEIEVLERLLIDNRFGVRDRRSRELSEEDLIMNVDVTWRVIQETLALRGVRA